MEHKNKTQPNNPLHGVKLADMLDALYQEHGWDGLANHVNVRCFTHDPSIKSSLKFLRTTPWARTKIEGLYLKLIQD